MRSYKKNIDISSQCKIKGQTYIATNTYPFDAIVVDISVACNNNPTYKNYIMNTSNDLL